MILTSPAFQNNGPLPAAFTGYGEFKSPPLAWSSAPKGTREFALLFEDDDVPVASFSVHWLIYNIPASSSAMPSTIVDRENRTHPSLIKGASQGLNAMK